MNKSQLCYKKLESYSHQFVLDKKLCLASKSNDPEENILCVGCIKMEGIRQTPWTDRGPSEHRIRRMVQTKKKVLQRAR